jgi:DNA-binding NarL/FixJ family response regulator
MKLKAQDTVNALIVSQDVIARLGLRALLQVSGKVAVVGEAEGGMDALAQIGRLGAHVVLLHARTARSKHLTDLRDIARHVPVLLLVQDESSSAVERAVRAGAIGYLIDGHYSPDELVAAVLATASGQPRLSPVAVRALIDRLRCRAHREPTRPSQLSTREIEIVGHLVRGFTNGEIARSLGISEKTVKNHVNHIYAKLHTRNRAETVALWLSPDAPDVAR